MLSPVIDLSGYGMDTPVIQWWDWKHIESASYDWARVDVTKDGGATWTAVWGLWVVYQIQPTANKP